MATAASRALFWSPPRASFERSSKIGLHLLPLNLSDLKRHLQSIRRWEGRHSTRLSWLRHSIWWSPRFWRLSSSASNLLASSLRQRSNLPGTAIISRIEYRIVEMRYFQLIHRAMKGDGSTRFGHNILSSSKIRTAPAMTEKTTRMLNLLWASGRRSPAPM